MRENSAIVLCRECVEKGWWVRCWSNWDTFCCEVGLGLTLVTRSELPQGHQAALAPSPLLSHEQDHQIISLTKLAPFCVLKGGGGNKSNVWLFYYLFLPTSFSSRYVLDGGEWVEKLQVDSSWVPVAHACNTSYSGVWDRKDLSSRPNSAE
jgi:hypothetical protein